MDPKIKSGGGKGEKSMKGKRGLVMVPQLPSAVLVSLPPYYYYYYCL